MYALSLSVYTSHVHDGIRVQVQSNAPNTDAILTIVATIVTAGTHSMVNQIAGCHTSLRVAVMWLHEAANGVLRVKRFSLIMAVLPFYLIINAEVFGH